MCSPRPPPTATSARDYFTTRINSPDARKRRLIRELEALGHKVTLEPAAA
jgi:hypothetical protein